MNRKSRTRLFAHFEDKIRMIPHFSVLATVPLERYYVDNRWSTDTFAVSFPPPPRLL